MQTKIKVIISRLVLTALASIDAFFISKIKNTTVKNGLRSALAPVRETALALCDDNPRNDEQVEAIWKQYANIDLPVLAEGEIANALNQVEDADVRVVLTTLSNPVVNMLRVVTDGDPNNKAQLRAMFQAFVNDAGTQEVAVEHILIPLIEKKVKDETLRAFLLTLISEGLLDDLEG